MFNFIKGKIADKSEGMLVLETAGGLGFEIGVTDRFVSSVGLGDDTTVFVNMVVREDDVSIYGFSSKADQIMFRELIKVSGIGAKGALALLNELNSDEIRNAIIFQRSEELTRANGIGKKTAQRIVLELGEKMGKISVESAEIPTFVNTDAKSQALEALAALGYNRVEATAALSSVGNDDLDVEGYIKSALKSMK